MKGLIQSFTPLRTACAAALLMCQPVMASIWTNSDAEVAAAGVNINKQVCMADAYIKAGGSGMSNTLGASLNCTANDVEITKVVPVNPTQSCELGEVFTFQADITVKSNASERWDTTFYLPLNDKSPQVVQGANAQNCAIALPKPGQEGASQLDGDQCGDIKKSTLINDQYTLMNEPVTMLCADADGDNRADFSYCAAWDNQTGNKCNVDDDPVVGQVPSTKSKCKCDKFNIAVIVAQPPTLKKELIGSGEANEPEGTFRYQLTVTKHPGPGDLKVTALRDIVRSSTDAAVFADFNLASNAVQTVGNLTLLGNDPANTCDDLGLPKTLTAASPSLSCVLVMKVADENLPDDGTPELYQDFVRATATNATGTKEIGNDECDPTDSNPANDAGNCTNVVTVKMLGVPPVLDITKMPMKGPGLHMVGGAWFIDEAGAVTYEVVITNNSPVDAVLLTSLVDTAIANLLTDSSGTPACSGGNGLTLAKNGGKFTCQYVANVTLDQGDTYTNKAEVVGKDNEGQSATDNAMASVTLAAPSIVLVKEVAAVGSSPINDVTGFAEEAGVPEPGGKVVYRFTITNANSVSKEPMTLSGFTDNALFGPRASKSATQRSDECNFTTTVVVFGTPYRCTLVADVTGNASGPEMTLINTATVKAKAPNGKEVTSNEDMAKVNFLNVPPTMDSGFALKATVFLKVKNTSFEPIHLTSLKLLGVSVQEGASATGFAIRNDGGAFGGLSLGGCAEPGDSLILAPDEEYSCAFSVEFSPNFTADGFNTFTSDINNGDAVVVEFADEENSPVSADAEARIITEGGL